jgi:hypothetical protein
LTFPGSMLFSLSNRPENPRLSNLGMNGHLSKWSQLKTGGAEQFLA